MNVHRNLFHFYIVKTATVETTLLKAKITEMSKKCGLMLMADDRNPAAILKQKIVLVKEWTLAIVKPNDVSIYLTETFY